jgi:putative colanic acid biosynthesis UDP-glucose lipid carrier transferase
MGFFDDRCPERLSEKMQQQSETLLGKIASIVEFVNTHNVQQIYIALPMTSHPRVLALLDTLRDTTASIYFVPDIFLFDLIQARINTVNDILTVAVCESPFIGINGTIKRTFDVVVSLFILLLIAPLMLFIAIGIKLSSPGPVLFKQRRYGLDGKELVSINFAA